MNPCRYLAPDTISRWVFLPDLAIGWRLLDVALWLSRGYLYEHFVHSPILDQSILYTLIAAQWHLMTLRTSVSLIWWD
jgi:hypothetical protein